MFDRTNGIANLSAALSKAQGEITPARFDSVNPFFKSRYASLGAIVEAARIPLANNELSVIQLPECDGISVSVVTILAHSSGEYISTKITLPLEVDGKRSAAQGMGSTITYLRRYSYAALLGIYADEDTDGHTQEVKDKPRKVQPTNGNESAPDAVTGMSLEDAENVTNRDGVRYGDLESDKLSVMQNGILKVMNDGRDKPEHAMKLDAIRTILAARAE